MVGSLSDDGLVTPVIGPWGERKYELVRQYAAIFANSMKRKWNCRVYIDLFAGAGRSRVRRTNRIIQASPLLALEIPDKFDIYIFCEEDEAKIDSLKTRIHKMNLNNEPHFIYGDCNERAGEIKAKIPQGSKDYTVLSFCFADPYKLKNLHFATIEVLAQRFVDFLILIPTGMDANRNLHPYYLRLEDKTIDNFVGSSDWRDSWRNYQDKQSVDHFLTDFYGKRMQRLKYRYEGIQSTQLIRSTDRNLPLYRLAFFSRHDLGEQFWRQVKKYSNPQTSFWNRVNRWQRYLILNGHMQHGIRLLGAQNLVLGVKNVMLKG